MLPAGLRVASKETDPPPSLRPVFSITYNPPPLGSALSRPLSPQEQTFLNRDLLAPHCRSSFDCYGESDAVTSKRKRRTTIMRQHIAGGLLLLPDDGLGRFSDLVIENGRISDIVATQAVV